MSQAELHRKSIAQMKVGLCSIQEYYSSSTLVVLFKKKGILMENILQINTPSVQDMHIYADPSCIPVVRIEQHVMVIPQHCSSKDFLTDASEPAGTIVPPLLQGQSLEEKTCGFKSGRILRAVIFCAWISGKFLGTGNNCFSLITYTATYLAETSADP